jgi:hypothetical protein
LKLALLAVFVLGICLYPLWPVKARVVVWYISITFLLIIVALTIIQLVVFGLIWLLGYDLWILPNLWSDDAGITELFKPLYTFKKSAGGQSMYRIGTVVALIALGFWVSQQPQGMSVDISALLARFRSKELRGCSACIHTVIVVMHLDVRAEVLDETLSGPGNIVNDLYAGTLLTDSATHAKGGGKRNTPEQLGEHQLHALVISVIAV